LESAFDGKHNHFKHPLGGAKFEVNPYSSADIAHGIAQKSRPVLTRGDDRAQFLAFWRLWRWWASDHHDARLAFLPADTRLPDHTIWIHNCAVSALQACVTGSGKEARCQPAFLLFQIGPVQEYIAQARRTLDLWSGSYLLSYLIGCGLRHIALNYGPDNVVFPNLCGQPIFDLLLRDDVWTQARVQLESSGGDQTLWDAFGYDSDYGRRLLLTPSLPNRFLAIVPADKAADIAREVEKIIRETHVSIASEVWNWAKENLASAGVWTDEQRRRFDAQNERFLDIAWQVLPWPESPDKAFEDTAVLPEAGKHAEDQGPRASLYTILEMAKRMPADHRDVRNFECERYPEGRRNSQGRDISGWKDRSKLKPDARLDNPGVAWSALCQLVSWQLDAVRQTRAWKAWASRGWDVGRSSNKDSLNGREEALLDLRGPDWNEKRVVELNEKAGVPNLFKTGELLGATSLIKRLWSSAWLQTQHGFKNHDWRMPDTRHIAVAQPFAKSDDDPEFDADADRATDRDANKYYAVLALDGDEMGKWISGLHPKMPKLGDQLADYQEGGERKGAKVYFEKNGLGDLLGRKRSLSPSFHLQFSEMLANFSNFCVRRIVEAHDGRLIYSGGDDVLALLPAHQALACSRALRAAFRGEPEALNNLRGAWRFRNGEWVRENVPLFACDQPGFIRLAPEAPKLEGEPAKFHAMVPGPAADCSVGIAIAHFKAPLQDVVRAAQAAEKRAKKQLGRSAVAVTLYKRSGETIEWGAKWEGGGLELYRAIADALEAGQLSAKFPHRFTELLEAYVTDSTPLVADTRTVQPLADFPVDDIIRREFQHCLERQRGTKFPREKAAADELLAKLRSALDSYLASLAAEDPSHQSDQADATERTLRSLIGLCQTVAFAHRTTAETTHPEPKGT
jgi:CRISPR-associated protein Cas10/Cmr2 subtype III-B